MQKMDVEALCFANHPAKCISGKYFSAFVAPVTSHNAGEGFDASEKARAPDERLAKWTFLPDFCSLWNSGKPQKTSNPPPAPQMRIRSASASSLNNGIVMR